LDLHSLNVSNTLKQETLTGENYTLFAWGFGQKPQKMQNALNNQSD